MECAIHSGFQGQGHSVRLYEFKLDDSIEEGVFEFTKGFLIGPTVFPVAKTLRKGRRGSSSRVFAAIGWIHRFVLDNHSTSGSSVCLLHQSMCSRRQVIKEWVLYV